MEQPKRRFGDRRDGRLLRDLDSMHIIVPMIHPNRCDNEAYISERVELDAINAWLANKNAVPEEVPYTFFHVVVAAMLKTLWERPKLNRFIANKNTYQRNSVTASFVVKKKFADESGEALARVRAGAEDTISSLHAQIARQITGCRSDKADSSTNSMDIVSKLPRPLTKAVAGATRWLDKRGLSPKAFVATDPYYASVILSNLGSIKLKCGYHHLTNWGTNSVFCVIGEKKKTPSFDEDGNVTMRETVDLGLTIDERLADGYYYSKSIALLKHILQNPELLERPMNEKVVL